MILVLLQDREHSRGSLVSFLAGAHRAHAREHAIAIDEGTLLVEAHHQQQGATAGGITQPDEFPLLEIFEGGTGGHRLTRAPERRLGDRYRSREAGQYGCKQRSSEASI